MARLSPANHEERLVSQLSGVVRAVRFVGVALSFSLAEATGSRVVWLLDLTLSGRPFRYSTRGVTVTDADGNSFEYVEGLEDFPASVLDGGFSGSFGLTINDSTNWALLEAQGVQLDRQPAVLRRWVEGTELERARVVIIGVTEDPEYASVLDPLSVSLTGAPIESSDTIPGPTETCDANTWPVTDLTKEVDPNHVGAAYPYVFGAPGQNPGGTPFPAVPAPMVESDDPPASNDRLLLNARPSGATTAEVYNLADGTINDNRSTIAGADLLGRAVTLCTIGATLSTPITEQGQKWYSGWNLPGGIQANGETVRGAADVIEYLITRFTDIPLDVSRFRAQSDRLNAYKLDFFINSPTNAWDFIRQSIAPLLPVVQRETVDGVYWQFLDWGATKEDVIHYFDTERLAIDRASNVRRDGVQIRNEITIQFAPFATSRKYRERRVITAQSGRLTGDLRSDETDTRIIENYRCAISQRVYGLRPHTLTSHILWDAATASRVLRDQALRHALPRRVISYTAGPEFEGIEIGDVASLTDAELSLSSEVCLVTDITAGGGDLTVVELTLLENPAARVRAT